MTHDHPAERIQVIGSLQRRVMTLENQLAEAKEVPGGLRVLTVNGMDQSEVLLISNF